MPSASVKLAEIRSKIVFEEDPPLARLGRFDAPLAGVQAQHGRGHAQELGRFVQVEGAHGLALPMAAHPHVVAARLQLGLAVGVRLQSLRNLPRRVVVVGLKGM